MPQPIIADWHALIEPIHDSIYGTKFNDQLSALAVGDVVSGLNGDDDISSEFNRTALIGGAGKDVLHTGVLLALSPDTSVDGTAVQIGGEGGDALDALITFQRSEPIGQVSGEGHATLFLDGQGGDDVIYGAGKLSEFIAGSVTIDVQILGGAGNDTITADADARGSLGDNHAATFLKGESGDDHITANAITEFNGSGASAENVLDGGDGADILEASATGQSNNTYLVSNTLDGGAGDDILRATNVSNAFTPICINKLSGGTGNDVLEASQRSSHHHGLFNYLDGGAGNDVLNATAVGAPTGTPQSRILNSLDGGSGADVLTARIEGSSIDPLTNDLRGGDGNDRLEATIVVRADPLDNSEGATNHLSGGFGNDLLTATIVGESPGASFLNGDAGDDQLAVFGGFGNVLDGGAGKDRLVSGIGDDSFLGGADNDVFVFGPSNGQDAILDFERGRDKIDLTALASEGIHRFNDLTIEVSGSSSTVHLGSENAITVAGVTNLRASDFWFS